MSSNSTIRTFVLGSIAALVLSACGSPEAAAPGAMAAPEINVATVVQEKSQSGTNLLVAYKRRKQSLWCQGYQVISNRYFSLKAL